MITRLKVTNVSSSSYELDFKRDVGVEVGAHVLSPYFVFLLGEDNLDVPVMAPFFLIQMLTNAKTETLEMMNILSSDHHDSKIELSYLDVRTSKERTYTLVFNNEGIVSETDSLEGSLQNEMPSFDNSGTYSLELWAKSIHIFDFGEPARLARYSKVSNTLMASFPEFKEFVIKLFGVFNYEVVDIKVNDSIWVVVEEEDGFHSTFELNEMYELFILYAFAAVLFYSITSKGVIVLVNCFKHLTRDMVEVLIDFIDSKESLTKAERKCQILMIGNEGMEKHTDLPSTNVLKMEEHSSYIYMTEYY